MQILIEIPEEAKQAFDCAESNDLKGSYYDFGGIIGNAIKNGTPLPEHGRLIDANILESKLNEVFKAMKEVPTIIPATKNEFFNFDAPIIKKQTATKEGE